MYRSAWSAALWAGMVILAITVSGSSRPLLADEPNNREIPSAFTPLEYLVGKWNGQAVPKDSAQSFRGWPESHTWAWLFTKGKPTGLSLVIEGGKILAAGKLTYDPGQGNYRLEGTRTKPLGGPIAFAGKIDANGKMLVLEQVALESGSDQPRGLIRLSLRPNANSIRYTMGVDRKEPGSTQFNRTIEVGLTKDGESLASGATTSERPKCIVTGGAATMTLTYQGRTFQICCTGCRDEFNENPEKYIKKASLIAQSEGGQSRSNRPAPARVSRSEDAFAADVDDPVMKKGSRTATAASPKAALNVPAQRAEVDENKAAETRKSATKKAAEKSATSPNSTRAASLLSVGQNLEKSGKSDAALSYYKRIVKDFPDTTAAKTAKSRIKAIENP